MESFVNILFNSKLLNLKPYFYNFNKNYFLNLESLKNNKSDVYYIIIFNLNNKFKFLLFASKKNTDIFDNCNFCKTDYLNIYNFFCENEIEMKNLKEENLKIFWKNQFIVSDFIDFFTGGLVENINNNWSKYDNNLLNESEINKELFEKINYFLKTQNVCSLEDLYEKKKNYLNKDNFLKF